jgi:hypothetical protein
VGTGVGVGAGVGVVVGVAAGVGVAVGIGVEVGVAVTVGVGVPVGCDVAVGRVVALGVADARPGGLGVPALPGAGVDVGVREDDAGGIREAISGLRKEPKLDARPGSSTSSVNRSRAKLTNQPNRLSMVLLHCSVRHYYQWNSIRKGVTERSRTGTNQPRSYSRAVCYDRRSEPPASFFEHADGCCAAP